MQTLNLKSSLKRVLIKMNKSRVFFLSGVLFFISTSVGAINVVVTLPVMASIVSPLLSENDTVTVILKGQQTPHGFRLKPSHLYQFNQSDLIILMGTGVDNWAQKAVKSYSKKVLKLSKQPGLVFLEKRSHSSWAEHSVHYDQDHEDHYFKSQHKQDGHIWLSPTNMQFAIKGLVAQLQARYPQRAAEFALKAKQFIARIKDADAFNRQALSAVSSKSYVVLHDGFQYFEKHYGLKNVGAIKLNAELNPSIKHLLFLQKKLKTENVQCVFKEPQFPGKQVLMLVDGLNINVGELDPLNGLTAQSRLSYDQFIRGLGQQFLSCLK